MSNRSDGERQILYDLFYVWNLKTETETKLIGTENRFMARNCWTFFFFNLNKLNNFLKDTYAQKQLAQRLRNTVAAR